MTSLLRIDAIHRELPAECAAHVELWNSSFSALRRVRCRVRDRRLALSGSVPSYYVKQVAQSLLMERFGDEYIVENRLEVASQTPSRD